MPCGFNVTCSLTEILTSSLGGFNVTSDADGLTVTPAVTWTEESILLHNSGGNAFSIDKHNETTLPIPRISDTELSLILATAVLTTACNLVVLLASKFTSGGKSPTLVFIRSLCVSDSLIGMYGIFKLLMYIFMDSLLLNFFLAESLFFTASFASGLSLLSLNIDCYMKLSEPLNYSSQMDKKNVITVMVMLWNLSFIGGFLPQMGWRDMSGEYHVLRFFVFHPWHYLLFFTMIMMLVFSMNIVVTIYMKRRISLIQSHRSFLSPNSTKFHKYHTLVVTAGIDMVFWVLSYFPFFIYLAVYCDVCFLRGVQAAEKNIVYFIPVFLIKSFVSGIVHGYRTAQINAVMKNFSRRFSRIVRNSRKHLMKDVYVTSNGRGNSSSVRSTDLSQNDHGSFTVQSDSGSQASKDIELISSQLTVYSNVHSDMDSDGEQSQVTKL